MARDNQDTLYRGRNRLSGNYGRLWINNTLIFEISAFECKVTADRDDVIIGISKDSKITSLTGEGSFTVKTVSTRGMDTFIKNWQDGRDTRLVFIGEISDPDSVKQQRERIRIANVWLNEIDVMSFSKGEVIEREYSFGFTPEDLTYENSIKVDNNEIQYTV